MSKLFRDLLKIIGNGQHTGDHLTRAQATQATRMILLEEAAPAQIGAFLIAHRIKRPTGEELAGMLDAYQELGPTLPDLQFSQALLTFGYPYDGRSRTSPVAPLLALVLASSGSVVFQHGSGVCPTKYGLPLIQLWQGLGVDWSGLKLTEIQRCLEAVGIGFLYLPDHFPQAQKVMIYRDQIGKRPPLATLELIWSPYQGSTHLISGYVHPPTEEIMLKTFDLRGIRTFTTVKGLEGGCDLSRERTGILNESGQRLLLRPRDYHLNGKDPELLSLTDWIQSAQALLQVDASFSQDFAASVYWTSGYMLYRTQTVKSLEEGLDLARILMTSGQVLAKLRQLQNQLNQFR